MVKVEQKKQLNKTIFYAGLGGIIGFVISVTLLNVSELFIPRQIKLDVWLWTVFFSTTISGFVGLIIQKRAARTVYRSLGDLLDGITTSN